MRRILSFKNELLFTKFSLFSKMSRNNFSIFFKNNNKLTLLNNKFSFCTLERLNIDKITISKSDDKPFELNLEKKVEKEFNKEDYIVEYTPEIKWEDAVLKCEIPVVVDCYAK